MGTQKNKLWVRMCESQQEEGSYQWETVLFLNFWLIPIYLYLSASMRVVLYDKKLNIFKSNKVYFYTLVLSHIAVY